MNAPSIIVLCVVIGLFIAVILYWIIRKVHGKPALDQEYHMSGKTLYKLYQVKKKADLISQAKKEKSDC